MLWFWGAVGALLAVLLIAAALSDLYWRRKGFRHEIRGSGRNREKVRIRINRPENEPPPARDRPQNFGGSR